MSTSITDPSRRCRRELLALGILTPVYIAVGPRGMPVHMTLALLFLAYVVLDARYTREQVWSPITELVGLRWRKSLATLGPLTLLLAGLFFVLGLSHNATVEPLAVVNRLVIYMAWALVQQTLFQFYLLGRLLRAYPALSPKLVLTVNGLAYGLVHLPDTRLTALTCLAGLVWTRVYYRDRLLLPVAVSHAILGTAYYSSGA